MSYGYYPRKYTYSPYNSSSFSDLVDLARSFQSSSSGGYGDFTGFGPQYSLPPVPPEFSSAKRIFADLVHGNPSEPVITQTAKRQKKSMQSIATQDILPPTFYNFQFRIRGSDWDGPIKEHVMDSTTFTNPTNQCAYHSQPIATRSDLKSYLTDFSYVANPSGTQAQFNPDLNKDPQTATDGAGYKNLKVYFYSKYRIKNNSPSSAFLEVAAFLCLNDTSSTPFSLWQEKLNSVLNTNTSYATDPLYDMIRMIKPQKSEQFFNNQWRMAPMKSYCLKPGQEVTVHVKNCYVGNPFDLDSTASYLPGSVMVQFRTQGDICHDSSLVTNVGLDTVQLDVIREFHIAKSLRDGLMVQKGITSTSLDTITTSVDENVDK